MLMTLAISRNRAASLQMCQFAKNVVKNVSVRTKKSMNAIIHAQKPACMDSSIELRMDPLTRGGEGIEHLVDKCDPIPEADFLREENSNAHNVVDILIDPLELLLIKIDGLRMQKKTYSASIVVGKDK